MLLDVTYPVSIGMCVKSRLLVEPSNAVFLYYKLPWYYDGKHRAIPNLVIIPLDVHFCIASANRFHTQLCHY